MRAKFINESMNKQDILDSLLSRDNTIIDEYDKIKMKEDVLKISLCDLSNYRWKKKKYHKYEIDLKNNKLMDFNLLGDTYDLTNEEVDDIVTKYYKI